MRMQVLEIARVWSRNRKAAFMKYKVDPGERITDGRLSLSAVAALESFPHGSPVATFCAGPGAAAVLLRRRWHASEPAGARLIRRTVRRH